MIIVLDLSKTIQVFILKLLCPRLAKPKPLNPKPVNPKPKTRKPKTLNPKTLNPKPLSLDPKRRVDSVKPWRPSSQTCGRWYPLPWSSRQTKSAEEESLGCTLTY